MKDETKHNMGGAFSGFSFPVVLPHPDTIRDVRDLRQDHASYLPAGSEGKSMLSAEAQNRMDEEYNIIHFSVWHQKSPFHAQENRVRDDFKKFAAKPGYGENKRRLAPTWIKKLQTNASLSGYPNSLARGITIRNTDLRVLPTVSPHFYDRDGDAWAWPFDNLQRSSVAANTPVFICHTSADKAWLLVETSFTFGWIPASDIAYVDDPFIRTWESGHYAVVIRDYTSVTDENGRFLIRASIGHIFPFAGQSSGKTQVLVALPDHQRNGVIQKGTIAV